MDVDATNTRATDTDPNSSADATVQEKTIKQAQNEAPQTDNRTPVSSVQGVLSVQMTPPPATAAAKGLSPIPTGLAALPPHPTKTETDVPSPATSHSVPVTDAAAVTEYNAGTDTDKGPASATIPDTGTPILAIPAANAIAGGPSQPAVSRSRIVRPDGAEKKVASKIPVNNTANRPKTPLRARPSSAGRLQGNASMTVSNSAGTRPLLYDFPCCAM